MQKGITSLTIDADLLEFARVKRMEDPSFSLSLIINDFLRDFFGQEIKDLDKRKVIARKAELERELALLKSQEVAIDAEKEKQQQEKYEKIYGKGVKVREVHFD